MTRKRIIERTLKAISHLPREKEQEISDFMAKRYEEQRLSKGIQKSATDSTAFDFLHDEEDLYTEPQI